MVPVIDRLNYRAQLMRTPKIKAFLHFIEESQETFTIDTLSEVDALYYSSLNALALNDPTLFIPLYTDFTRREPQEGAPFVRDDYLLFLLVCCVIKFSTESLWLQKVLNCRRCSLEECTQTINTFKNLLAGDYQNSSNLTSVVIIIQHLLNRPLPKDEQLKAMYRSYMKQTFPFYKSDQLNVIALSSIDLIITEADITGDGTFITLKNFEIRFIKRTENVATGIYYILMGVLIIWTIQAYGRFKESKEMIDGLSAVGGVLSFLGWTIPNLLKKDTIVSFLAVRIRRILGYT